MTRSAWSKLTNCSATTLALFLLAGGVARADALAQSIAMTPEGAVPAASVSLGGIVYFVTNGTSVSCGALFSYNPNTGMIALIHKFVPYNSETGGGKAGCNPVSIRLGEVRGNGKIGAGVVVTTTFGGANGTGGLYTYLPSDDGSEEIAFSSSVASPLGATVAQALLALTDEYGGTAGHGAVYIATLSKNGVPGPLTTVFSFPGGAGGGDPGSPAVMGADGNLYGTLRTGGVTTSPCPSFGGGMVYQLTPPTSGTQWNENVIHTFQCGAADFYDSYAPVVFDASGNVYGTAAFGGKGGQGGVFMLKPQVSYPWPMTTLLAFPDPNGPTRGGLSESGVTLDASGNVYGTTLVGGPGSNAYGVVFELEKSVKAPWKEMVLYSFHGGVHGANPFGSLVIDSSNDIIGTTLGGGKHPTTCTGGVFAQPTQPGCGTLFVLTPPP